MFNSQGKIMKQKQKIMKCPGNTSKKLESRGRASEEHHQLWNRLGPRDPSRLR